MSLRRLRITLVALVALVTFAGSTGTGWAEGGGERRMKRPR